ncbi:unnamed protein product [Rangifer tarandus platyrhynchus]|uniref:Uncharacterized protein n=1 Tax=Rangifer tarandus platyrhynchus TaxID=3082113 RepID=A0AC59Z450_RANTA
MGKAGVKTVRMEEKGSANEDGLETGEQESARGEQGRKDERKTPVSRSDQWMEVATLRSVALLRCNGRGGVGGINCRIIRLKCPANHSSCPTRPQSSRAQPERVPDSSNTHGKDELAEPLPMRTALEGAARDM